MIDLHHHIIYGVDDGARSREMSEAMLERAADQGVTQLVCSSHARPGERNLDLDRYFRHMEVLNAYIRAHELHITLLPGCEIMYTSRTPSLLQAGKVLTLNNTRNVLVEFMPPTPYEFIRRALMDLAEAGYHVVLAHVERYSCLRNMDRLLQLRDETMPHLQMNADTALSTKGLFGDRYAKGLLRQELIDVLGSDAHSAGNRCCKLGDAYDFITNAYGSDMADALCCSTPEALLGL